jgi:ribosome-associated protein
LLNTEQLKKIAIDALEDLKAVDLVTYDVSTITTIADVMIICTGRSNRHVRSIAESVVTSAKANKVSYIRMEGQRESEWIIVDLGDVVVHIMQPTSRAFYNLEDLWEPIEVMREKQG